MKYKAIYNILLLAVCITSYAQDDVKDGYVKIYYPNGQVSSEGMMADGKPDGYWKTYYVTGIIKSEGLRTSFELDSTWIFYNQLGEMIQKINYKYGKKNGYSTTYSYEKYAEGIITSKELYLNDKKEGRAYYYYDDGTIREELTYKDGRKEGSAIEYDRNGNITGLLAYHNNFLISRESVNRYNSEGQQQGEWKTFYPDGRIQKEMYYRNGVLDGVYKEYNPNGSVAVILKYNEGIIEEDDEALLLEELDVRNSYDENGNLIFTGSYKDDTPIGIHRFYNEKGQVINAKIYNDSGIVIAEGVIDDKGNKEGIWKEFYLSGELRATGRFLDNRKAGTWTYFYKSGEKEQEGDYLRGLPDGLWTWFYADGNVLREESYFNGREDGEMKEYDSIGNVITLGDYINGEREGEWLHSVGDHMEKGIYQTGLMTGIWNYYYADNSLQFEGEFIQGQPDGKHKFYYPNGIIREERFYEMGVRERNWKKFDENGNLVLTVTYKNDVEYRINGTKVELPQGSVRVLK